MELTIEQALQQGVTAHKEGKLQEAERLYRAILQSQSKHGDANHNLGVLAVSVNKADAALPLFKTALEADPKMEQFWLSYIDALIKEQQFGAAKKALEQGKNHGIEGDKIYALEVSLEELSQSGSKNALNGFFNEDFNAFNVLEFSFDSKILDGIKEIVSSPLDRDDFYVARPEWSSDIQWESACSFKSFKIFNDVFKKLIINTFCFTHSRSDCSSLYF